MGCNMSEYEQRSGLACVLKGGERIYWRPLNGGVEWNSGRYIGAARARSLMGHGKLIVITKESEGKPPREIVVSSKDIEWELQSEEPPYLEIPESSRKRISGGQAPYCRGDNHRWLPLPRNGCSTMLHCADCPATQPSGW